MLLVLSNGAGAAKDVPLPFGLCPGAYYTSSDAINRKIATRG